jgi:DNA (cytosine-5)-methyltransferase 1
MLRVLDLFSGIGGFSLGLERTGGFKTVAFCEIEPFPRKVLAKHWPEVTCYHDVRELTANRLAADGIGVDVICGGFPCQDISVAGKGAGLAGERSGLWSEFARLIGELRPRYAIVENVSALLGRGLADVLGDLAALGYDAEWHCIPASAVGAPHRRDRIWIVAHPRRFSGAGWGAASHLASSTRASEINSEKWQRNGDAPNDCCSNVADADDQPELQPQGCECSKRGWASDGGEDVANSQNNGIGWRQQQQESGESTRDVADTNGTGRVEQWRLLPVREEFTAVQCGDWWLVEPDVGRVANGVPSRVDRLKGLGNAVVPQIPELIGRAILAARA